MTDGLTRHDRDLIYVNREANRIDDYLKDMGAEGRGLGERAQSLNLSTDLQRHMKTISGIRNRVVHDSQPLSDRDRQRFQSAVDEAVRLLEGRGARRYSPPPPPQRTSGGQATYTAPAPAPAHRVRASSGSGAWLRFPWVVVTLVGAGLGLLAVLGAISTLSYLLRGQVVTALLMVPSGVLVPWLLSYNILRWVRRK